jgi:hypothetical protein
VVRPGFQPEVPGSYLFQVIRLQLVPQCTVIITFSRFSTISTVDISPMRTKRLRPVMKLTFRCEYFNNLFGHQKFH